MAPQSQHSKVTLLNDWIWKIKKKTLYEVMLSWDYGILLNKKSENGST